MPRRHHRIPQCVWDGAESRCQRVGVGQPPYCREHFYSIYYGDDAGDQLNDDLIDSFLEHPVVADLFGRFVQGVEQLIPSRKPVMYGGAYHAEWPPKPPPPPDPSDGYHDSSAPAAEPQSPPAEDPRVVLGFSQDEDLDEAKIKRRQRDFAGILHPDRQGGNNEAMRRINVAADALLSQNR